MNEINCAYSVTSSTADKDAPAQLEPENLDDSFALVSVVLDVFSYLSMQCPKLDSAVWVRGLSKAEEDDEIEQMAINMRIQKAPMKVDWFLVDLGPKWLWYPNCFGALYICVMLYNWCVCEDCFPAFWASENPMVFMRRSNESLLFFLRRISPSFLCSSQFTAELYALSLSVTVALASQHFAALCAVGAGLLYFLAMSIEVVLVYVMQYNELKESDFLAVGIMLSITRIVKWLGPILSLFLVNRTLRLTIRSHVLSLLRQFALALPLLALIICLVTGQSLVICNWNMCNNSSLFLGTAFMSCTFFIVSVACHTHFELPVLLAPERMNGSKKYE